MKAFKLFGFIGLSVFLLSNAVSTNDNGAFEAQVNTMKQECKDQIKDSRYEGSKVTYYVPSTKKQTKSVELFLFVAKEYQIAVNAKKSAAAVTIKVYDAASDVPERVLIKEIKGAQGKLTVINSSELNKLYKKKMPEVERLKNIHIEYNIGTGKGNKEAVVLVYGHKA